MVRRWGLRIKIKRIMRLLVLAVTILFSTSCLINTLHASGQLYLLREAKFEIPAQNSTITFAVNGTYQEAHIESDIWTFVNLQFDGSQQQEKLNFTASAKNCDLTISSYRFTKSNTTLGSLRLRYTVVGHGIQSFNFGALPADGLWSVVINGVFVGQEDGWTVSDETSVIVTGAMSNSNVSIIYYTYPDSFVSIANQSFLERNSVLIATAITLTLTVVVGVMVKKIGAKEPEAAGSLMKSKMNEADN